MREQHMVLVVQVGIAAWYKDHGPVQGEIRIGTIFRIGVHAHRPQIEYVCRLPSARTMMQSEECNNAKSAAI